MQNVHPASRGMHPTQTTIETTTQIVTLHPRRIALHHLKRFAKLSLMVATTITAILYALALVVGV